MGVIIFNGISSMDYGIQVEHPPEYQSPKRDYEVIHIPGRNGDLVIDNGSYQNVNRTYQIAIGDKTRDYTTMANNISEWLHSASGYARLEDSYEPEYYRMAMFEEEITVENILQHAGRLTINFNCKPQRFLKSGEETLIIKKNGSNSAGSKIIYNPTGFNSLPLIRIVSDVIGTQQKHTGKLYIGKYNISINEFNDYLFIDSEIQDAYKGTENRNSYIQVNNGFPELVPGENVIGWLNGIGYMEVIPRWWTL